MPKNECVNKSLHKKIDKRLDINEKVCKKTKEESSLAENVKEIIAKNLSVLRKESRLTQQQLAEKLNYSDKAVSRWENAETLPDIETLCKICEIYGVRFEYLLQKEQPKKNQYAAKGSLTGRILITFIIVCSLWIAATLTYTYVNVIFGVRVWTIFMWAVPLSAVICEVCNAVLFKNKALGCVLISVICWTSILSLYLQTLKYNMWMLFIMGVPLQAVVILITIFRYKNPSGALNKRSVEK
jgi:transcriptional regulator with XRE-family HTH domain